MIWDSRPRAIQRKMQDEAKENINHNLDPVVRLL